MTKKNVLVFPCGSEIGLELHKSLNYSTHFNLFGGSSVSDHGEYVYKNYIGDLPNVSDSDYVEKLNEIIGRYNIDFIFPAHDSVVLKLAQEKEEGNLSCNLITSPISTCEVSRSKLATYKKFKGIIPTPKVYQSPQEITEYDFPVFLKPDIGQGSKGTQLARNMQEVEFYTKKDSSLLALEYLPGKEYTIDCFTDKNGQLLFCEGRERKRISNGISVNSSIVDDERFGSLAEKINSTLHFRGVWFFQVKENSDGELVLMEIAPRVAGTMGLARARGINLPLLSLFDAMNFDVSLFRNEYEIVIDRALHNSYRHNINYDHVYLDFDDLVIFENKVNPSVIAFVYQCINNNVKIHLLTKHKEDLAIALKKYRLEDVFDEIIWVRDDSEKHLRITEKSAIFIDDSFAERKNVHDILGIPVFDAHMIECLIEKF